MATKKKTSPEPDGDGPHAGSSPNAVKVKEKPLSGGSGRRVAVEGSTMTSAPVSSRSGRSNTPTEDPASQQANQFDQAIALFQSGQFQAARALFEQVAEGPTRDLAFSAKMHVRMCEKRMEQAAPALETAEDHYTYGVALTNQRRLPEAQRQFQQALAMKEASYFHYALGYCLALSGDAPAAIQHTRRAIEMDAANRTALRNDAEFMAALGSANVQAILR